MAKNRKKSSERGSGWRALGEAILSLSPSERPLGLVLIATCALIWIMMSYCTDRPWLMAVVVVGVILVILFAIKSAFAHIRDGAGGPTEP